MCFGCGRPLCGAAALDVGMISGMLWGSLEFHCSEEGGFVMAIGQVKSWMARKETFTPEWYHVDATDQVLGRLAAKLAMVLMGKHKPTYTPHVDTGDFVVVTNCERIRLTGTGKLKAKTYDRYTYYPGGFKRETGDSLFERYPDRILRFAVKRMLPKNALGRQMLSKLKVYSGENHPHAAQQPKAWDF